MVDEHVLSSQVANTWAASLHGMGDRRLLFKFDVEPGKAFRLLVEERVPGLPPHTTPVRFGLPKPPLTPLTEMTVASDLLLFR